MLQRKRKRISKMKIFGEKDVLLMTELKIDTMSQNETTKLDIIVEVLGERAGDTTFGYLGRPVKDVCRI